MNKVITAWKSVAITPYQLVQSVKRNPKYKFEKIGFAGRLDPMAQGIMLLLVGEENKNRKKYEMLKKTYEFEVLFGVSTDTYDVMGIPTIHKNTAPPDKILEGFANRLQGKHTQKYPPYSYVKVQGKPLYWWARNGRISEIEIPQKEIEISESKYLGSKNIEFKKAITNIKKRISPVDGDFRQEEIIKKWEELLKYNPDKKFVIAKYEIKCTSGTYVRSIANNFGEESGSGALAYSITRTSVGKYSTINV